MATAQNTYPRVIHDETRRLGYVIDTLPDGMLQVFFDGERASTTVAANEVTSVTNSTAKPPALTVVPPPPAVEPVSEPAEVEDPRRSSFFATIALPISQMGFRVFPLSPNEKEPVAGFKNHQNLATTSEDTILGWAEKYPQSNVGVHSDFVLGGGFFLDCDKENMVQLYEERTGKKVRTFTVCSREERRHFYFLNTPRSLGLKKNITEKDTQSFSVRIKAYYVVGANSIHPDTKRPYRVIDDTPAIPIPDDFLDFLVAYAAEKSKKPVGHFFKDPAFDVEDDSSLYFDTEPELIAAPSPKQLNGPKKTEELDAIAAAFIKLTVADGVVKLGGHDTWLHSLAGKLRYEGGEESQILSILIRECEKLCEGYGTDYVEMCEKHAREICKKPVGEDPASLVCTIGGKPASTEPVAPKDDDYTRAWTILNDLGSVKVDGIDTGLPIHTTQVGLGRMLVHNTGKNVLYCTDDDTWRIWRGNIWTTDYFSVDVQSQLKTTLLNVQETVPAILKLIPPEVRAELKRKLKLDGDVRADEELTEDEERWYEIFSQAKRFAHWAEHSETSGTIVGASTLMRSESGISIGKRGFDAQEMLCNTSNGTIVFDREKATMVFREHNRDDRCTRMMPVAYDPEAQCPKFMKFIEWMFSDKPEVIPYLLTFLSLSLTSIVERQYVILYGKGANGKGTLSRILMSVFGIANSNYSYTTNFSTFTASRNAPSPNSPRADILALDGPRLVIASELNRKSVIDSALLKKLTGHDQENQRGMYEKGQTMFECVAKILLLTNEIPDFNDNSEGGRERLQIIGCMQQMPREKQDLTLADRIIATEASGILNLLIRYLLQYLDKKAKGLPALIPPNAILAYTEQICHSNTPQARFVLEEGILEEGCAEKFQTGKYLTRTSATIVYQRYCRWSQDNGEEAISSSDLKAYLEQVYNVKRKHRESGDFYLGFLLRTENNPTLPSGLPTGGGMFSDDNPLEF